MSIRTVRLARFFRQVSVDLGSTSFGAESRHTLANVGRRASRAAVSSLLLLEALDLAEQGVAVESIVFLWDWIELYDTPLGWYAENVRHERLDQRGITLVGSSLHRGR